MLMISPGLRTPDVSGDKMINTWLLTSLMLNSPTPMSSSELRRDFVLLHSLIDATLPCLKL